MNAWGNQGAMGRALRLAMVREQMRARGIRDERVLAAFEQVPRERFVPPGEVSFAYEDRPLPIGQGQTISQPYIVAYMTAHLDPQPGCRVLEIGTGSGYQAAILAALGLEVYSVERIAELSASARDVLADLGLLPRVRLRVGDGSLGWPGAAPFERILVTAGAPGVPPALVDQLADAGTLLVPVGDERTQQLVRVTRDGTNLRYEKLLGCRFVRLIGGQGWSADV